MSTRTREPEYERENEVDRQSMRAIIGRIGIFLPVWVCIRPTSFAWLPRGGVKSCQVRTSPLVYSTEFAALKARSTSN